MRLAGIRAVAPKRFVATTDSSHNLPIAENLLDRTFEAETPNTRWTADITYIWTSQGWLYLAVILDLFSRRIVGWAMDRTIERSLVLSALDMAIAGRRPIPNSNDVLHAKDARHALDRDAVRPHPRHGRNVFALARVQPRGRARVGVDHPDRHLRILVARSRIALRNHLRRERELIDHRKDRDR